MRILRAIREFGLMIAAFGLIIALLVISEQSRAAHAKEPAQKVQRLRDIALPADYRLVNVATQCFSGGTCEPWWLLQSTKDPSFFLYTNGQLEYAFTESK
jgi:hypothetical protein